MRSTSIKRRLAVESLESRLVLSSFSVAPTGSDSAAGTSGAPFRTLQRAADVVRAGDTVSVAAGTYAGFDLRTDGTASAPITFHAEPGVTINARNAKTPDGINLEGADYIVVEGFNVVGLPRAGIRSASNSHVTIRDNVADLNNSWGIFTAFSTDVTIEGNTTSRTKVQHGIYVSNSGDRPIIRDNISWGNYMCGIHINGDFSMGGDGIITGALVEGNTIYSNGRGGGSAINADGVQASRFQNNLLYDNHAGGFSLYKIDGAAGSKNNYILNNTVVMASDGRWALNINRGSTGNKVYNNIFYTYHSYRGSVTVSADSLSGFASNYNAVMDRFSADNDSTRITLAAWRTKTGQDRNSIIATPAQLFVNASANDFRLKTASPGINKGTSSYAPNADMLGIARVGAYDIGSYEYIAAA